MEEIGALMREAFDAETYRAYDNFAERIRLWNEIPTSTVWFTNGTRNRLIQEPPFFELWR